MLKAPGATVSDTQSIKQGFNATAEEFNPGAHKGHPGKPTLSNAQKVKRCPSEWDNVP